MTLDSLLHEIGARAPAVVSIVVFRSLPFVLYASVARSLPWPRRLFIVIAAIGLGVYGFRADRHIASMIEWTPVVAAYGVLGAALVHRLPGWLPRTAIKRGAVLALSALLFVILPAALLHHPAVAVSLILGWEVMLSAHSYCVDVSHSGEKPPLTDCVFFLLVNPTFVYAERGQLATRPLEWNGTLRLARGAVTMLGRDAALLLVGGAAFLAAASSGEAWPVRYARFCLTQAVLIVGLYCAHSGLASIQIGWMRILGRTVPERYHYPLFARDPQDFWHRWNIWVSRWANRYLFLPIALAVGRRRRGRAAPLLAVVLAFLGIGLLHDLGAYAFRLEEGWHEAPSFRLTLIFLLFAVIVVGWVGLARAAAPLARRLGQRAKSARHFVLWLALANIAFLGAALALPVLRTGRFAPAVEDFLHHGVHAR